MKTLKIILISVAAIVLVAVIAATAVIVSIVYPAPLVSGNGSKRIVCVGDSITYAQGVMQTRDKDSFTAMPNMKLMCHSEPQA